MADYGNYIVAENPFSLGGPPAYWLKALHEFDSSLVVMPSRLGFYYRVCQRRKPTFSAKLVNDIVKDDLDARMLAARNLVPVTTLLATANWGNYAIHFEELRRRNPHMMGGAAKVIQEVEAADRQTELDKAAQTDATLSDLSKDAWGYYLKKIGVRSHMWIPSTAKSSPPALRPASVSATPKPQVSSLFLP